MATKKSTAVQATSTSTDLASLDYGNLGGQESWGNLDTDDLIVPRLALLQALSPQIQEDEDTYIPGAKPGLWANTVTNEIGETVNFVPVFLDHYFAEWRKRKEGGGFIGRHELGSEYVEAAKQRANGGIQLTSEDGTCDILNTYEVFALVLDESGDVVTGMAVISFTVTKVKPFRKLLTQLRTIRGAAKLPLFIHRVQMGAIKTKNADGEAYYIPTFSPVVGSNFAESALQPSNEAHADILVAAQEFLGQIRSGEAKAAEEPRDVQAESADDGDEPF